MPAPTSWFTVEPGWEVADRSGAVIGEVRQVVGDEDADIFDGLRIEAADGGEHYVPGERVADIVEGLVNLGLDGTELPREDAEAPGGGELTRDRDDEL